MEKKREQKKGNIKYKPKEDVAGDLENVEEGDSINVKTIQESRFVKIAIRSIEAKEKVANDNFDGYKYIEDIEVKIVLKCITIHIEQGHV